MRNFKIIIYIFFICIILSGCNKTYYNDNIGYGIQYNTDIWKILNEKEEYNDVVSSLDDTAKIYIKIDKLDDKDTTKQQLNELYAKYISYGQISMQDIIIDGYEGILLKSVPIEEREFEPWEIRNIFVVNKDGYGYAFFYCAESEQAQNDYFSLVDELLAGFIFTK